MTQLLPPKKDVALALLEHSNVDVYLDPRARGVVVPPQFRKEPRLILKIGLNMPVPIPDLRLDEESMSCTLSFNRSPFYCVVPWSSVFAMVGEDGRGMVWPDDVPRELAEKAAAEKRPSTPTLREATPTRSEAAASARRGARASKSADDAPSSNSSSSKSGSANNKKRKKKEEIARPVLVAVPSEHASGRALSEDSDAPDSDRKKPPSRTGSERVAADSPSSRSRVPQLPRTPIPQQKPDGARPRRELPPYLRVVK